MGIEVLEEKKEEPVEEESNSTIDMIMNVFDHFDLSKLMGLAQDNEIDETPRTQEVKAVEINNVKKEFEHFKKASSIPEAEPTTLETSTTIRDGFVIDTSSTTIKATTTTTTNEPTREPVVITEENE